MTTRGTVIICFLGGSVFLLIGAILRNPGYMISGSILMSGCLISDAIKTFINRFDYIGRRDSSR